MKSTKIKFKNREGQTLSGILDMPLDRKPLAFAVFAHCFTCSKNLRAVGNISRGLTSEGIAVLRFDFTGLGQSEGEFSDTNFSTNVADLEAAAHFLEESYQAPQLMVGHSLGGTATLMAACQLDFVRAVATIGSPADPPHVKKLLTQSLEEIEENGAAEVNIGGRPFQIKKQFLDDLETSKFEAVLQSIDKSVIFFHSPQDEVVSIDNAAQLYQMARHPKSFISLDGADHLLTKAADSIYTGQVIARWASRYLELEERHEIVSENQVAVRNASDGFLTEVLSGKHHMLSDEPQKDGGDDLGPAPYDFLLASLGTCTAMTIRLYANHKKMPLKEVIVHLDHEKKYREDSEHPGESSSKIDTLTRNIELFGDLTPEQKDRIVEIANKCPVHRTLTSDIKIVTRSVRE